MVSQSFLENGAYLASGDLRLEVEQASRRRHKSDSHGSKPSRSMSLFASWRPKHLMNGDAKTSSPMRFSDLAKKEEDDVSISSLPIEDAHAKSGVTVTDSDSSSGGNCEVKDSGVELDEHRQSQDCVVSGKEGSHDSANHTSSLTKREQNSERQSGSCNTDSCTGSHTAPVPGGDSNFSPSSSQSQAATAASSTQSHPSPQLCNTDSKTGNGPSLQTVSTSDSSVKDSVGMSSLNSVDDGAPRGGGSGVSTPVKPPLRTSLVETGRAMSTPSTPKSHPQPPSVLECRTPVQKQNSLPDTQHTPRSEPRTSLERQAEYLLRRSQSLKRGSNDVLQKTNEAISGLWKFASKAASASYTKFNELKQSITTPIKNAASLSSLSRSQDDLDGTGSDRGSVGGGGDEDRASISSTSATLRDRLRGLGSQDVLSTGESSCTDGSAAQCMSQSFGENSLGKH